MSITVNPAPNPIDSLNIAQDKNNNTALLMDVLVELRVITFLLQEGFNLKQQNDVDSLRNQLLSDGGISRQ